MYIEILVAITVIAIFLIVNVNATEHYFTKSKKSNKRINITTRPLIVRPLIVRPLVMPFEPSLTMPNTTPQPLPLNFAKGPCKKLVREPENEEERALLQMLTTKLNEFVQHLGATYPENPMTKRVIENWNGEVKMSTKSTGATFFRETGCMVINPYYQTNKAQGMPGMQMDPMERIMTRILHELAHSWSKSHDASFYDAQRWFLRIASEDLGWTLHVTCRICCYYPGSVCSQDTVCPKCTWLETDCKIGARGCGDQ